MTPSAKSRDGISQRNPPGDAPLSVALAVFSQAEGSYPRFLPMAVIRNNVRVVIFCDDVANAARLRNVAGVTILPQHIWHAVPSAAGLPQHSHAKCISEINEPIIRSQATADLLVATPLMVRKLLKRRWILMQPARPRAQ